MRLLLGGGSKFYTFDVVVGRDRLQGYHRHIVSPPSIYHSAASEMLQQSCLARLFCYENNPLPIFQCTLEFG
jgi:hypothetical protein